MAVSLFVGIWGNGLLRGLHELAEALSSFQNPYRWLLLVTFVVASPIVLLWVLANRTEFTDTEIIHRNLVPTTTRKKYSEVSRVAITRRVEVRIEFVDGTKLIVRTGENNLAETINLLRSHVHAFAFDWLKQESR